jgi:hypothetical protein
MVVAALALIVIPASADPWKDESGKGVGMKRNPCVQNGP